MALSKRMVSDLGARREALLDARLFVGALMVRFGVDLDPRDRGGFLIEALTCRLGKKSLLPGKKFRVRADEDALREEAFNMLIEHAPDELRVPGFLLPVELATIDECSRHSTEQLARWHEEVGAALFEAQHRDSWSGRGPSRRNMVLTLCWLAIWRETSAPRERLLQELGEGERLFRRRFATTESDGDSGGDEHLIAAYLAEAHPSVERSLSFIGDDGRLHLRPRDVRDALKKSRGAVRRGDARYQDCERRRALERRELPAPGGSDLRSPAELAIEAEEEAAQIREVRRVRTYLRRRAAQATSRAEAVVAQNFLKLQRGGVTGHELAVLARVNDSTISRCRERIELDIRKQLKRKGIA